MKWFIRVLIVVLGSFYAVLIGLALLSDRLIFQPQPSSYNDESLSVSVSREGGRLMHIMSGDQRITAVYLPNPEAKFTLLFSHGNAEDLGDALSFLQMYRQAGFAVLAYDYRGYGTSTGRPSEKGVYEDSAAAYRFLTETVHISPDRVISMGRSVGCAPAIHIAANNKVAGLIAEAPFLSAFRVLTRVPLLPWDKFNNLRDIRRVRAPVLIIHGRNDQVVPFWHGERVFVQANEPKQFVAVDGAGHNDVLLVAGKKYIEAIQQFASKLKN
jgi:abhydrolase domain-containing protein 17